MTHRKPTYVTQPTLPPLERLLPFLKEIWSSKQLTNNGPLHQRLEKALQEYLDVPCISLCANGTVALMVALKVLEIHGEVITTPYTFVATSHSLLWNDCTPVFVDIDPDTCNLDPRKLDAAITSETTAILAVHCYGNACDTDALAAIAEARGLKLLYDAAHAFGVRCHCGSLLNHGDLSVASFHATKAFHTFEGGALICRDEQMKAKIDRIKNFGFVDQVTVSDCGINGKMSELHAAVGLAQLERFSSDVEQRRLIDAKYREALLGVRGVRLLRPNVEMSNFSYFPIFIEDEFPLSRDQLFDKLKEDGILTRRYFYPLVTEFPMYKTLLSARQENCPIAKDVANRVLCLPIYPDLDSEDQDRVIGHITRATTHLSVPQVTPAS